MAFSNYNVEFSQLPMSTKEGTYRGIGASWFNGRAIAKEDYERQLEANSLQNQFTAGENEKAREFNSLEAEKNREFNSLEAQKQRDFEREMSNTAISRAYADMKTVGINPILAYSSSASTPQGASASGSSASAGSSGASSGGYNPSGLNDPLSTALDIIGGLVLKKMPSKSISFVKKIK